MNEILYKELSYSVVGAAMEVDKIILELKAMSAISAAHIAQGHHYLAATGLRLAIILNFGAASLEMKRIVK